MSGIAGIIKLNNNTGIKQGDFEKFFSCILINNCKEKVIQKLNENGYIGIGELNGLKPKWFWDKHRKVHLFIWGEAFIKGKENLNNEYRLKSITALWQETKNQIVNHLSGFYNIYIYDENDQQHFLFNSRFGMMPLYYSIKENTLFFSSRLQSFIDYPYYQSSLNKNALLQYLVFNYPINNSSFVKDVKLLPAAASISGTNEWEIKKYDNHSWLLNPPIYNFSEGKNLVNEALNKSINKFTSLKSHIGCTLTGGWDGRLILSYLTKQDNCPFFLYTYGKKNHPDMKVARKLTAKFNFDHVPVFLEDDFVDNYESLSDESLYLSGGLRPANRSHYILMAKTLFEKTHSVISGNCASNILKIVQKPSPVYNKNVLKLFLNKNIEDAAAEVYKLFFHNNPWIKPFISKDEFVASILDSEIIKDNNLPPGRKFYHFLLTNSERKYFGSEIASYASYIYNYSPFIDSEVMESIVKTPYFGGHYNLLEQRPGIRYHLSKLYADLMLSNNPKLAKFTSDRGFPITWFLTPQGRAAGFFKKKIINRFTQQKDDNPFNHREGLKHLSRVWKEDNEFFTLSDHNTFDETFVNAISWNHWFKKYFEK
ncbi:MAG: asparagine synthase-related protein [bacterium]